MYIIDNKCKVLNLMAVILRTDINLFGFGKSASLHSRNNC